MEVSISSHYMNKNKVKKVMAGGEMLYIREALLSNSSECRLAEHQDDVPDLLLTQDSNTSKSKDHKSATEKQEVDEQSSETNILIAPRTKGYTLVHRNDTHDNSDIYAVNFDERVSMDEFKGQKVIAKKFGGYWSNFGKNGFLFKNEEAAQDFAETVMVHTVEEVEDEKMRSR